MLNDCQFLVSSYLECKLLRENLTDAEAPSYLFRRGEFSAHYRKQEMPDVAHNFPRSLPLSHINLRRPTVHGRKPEGRPSAF